MADFDVNISGVRVIKQELKAREQALSEQSPIYGLIGDMVTRDIKSYIFGNEGPGWPKSGRAGKVIRIQSGKRKGQDKQGKTLQDTGRLRNSITYTKSRNVVTIGTNVVYAPTHHYGDPKRNIPARPFLVIRPEVEKRIMRLIIKAAEEGKI